MMEVVSINVKQDDRRKEDMLEVLDVLRDKVESGEIKEFVAASIDPDGVARIHVAALDLPGGIGLFEIGKHLLIQQSD
jgi:hypothetical protein